jgi:hypothetical protein
MYELLLLQPSLTPLTGPKPHQTHAAAAWTWATGEGAREKSAEGRQSFAANRRRNQKSAGPGPCLFECGEKEGNDCDIAKGEGGLLTEEIQGEGGC